MSPVSIDEVLRTEFAQVEDSRDIRLGKNQARPLVAGSLIGLAFSGGGIRSATFNLGILQALAKSKLLHTIDYLSTVSGGGYIGSWLMAWMHHQEKGIAGIEEELGRQPRSASEAAEPPEVRFLRNYSNYLTPRKGVLGADFWTFAANYVRNTILNQVILVLAILGLLLLPRVAVGFLHVLEEAEEWVHGLGVNPYPWWQAQSLALEIGLLSGVLATALMGMNMLWLDPLKKSTSNENTDTNEEQTDKDYGWFAQPKTVRRYIVVPLVISCALFSYAFVWFFQDWHISASVWWSAPVLGFALYFGQWGGACVVRCLARLVLWVRKKEAPNRGPSDLVILGTAAIAGSVGGFLFLPFSYILFQGGNPSSPTHNKWHVVTYGTPALLALMLLIAILHLGLMGRELSDAHREWWARLGAYLWLCAVGWLGLFWVAVYFPRALNHLLEYEARIQRHSITFPGVSMWIVSTAYGVFFGRSPHTSHWIPDAPLSKKIKALLARMAPYVFIAGMLLGLSLLASKINDAAVGGAGSIFADPDDQHFAAWPTVAFGLSLLGAGILSWRVDINQFSVHNMYRNRLVRCYLGAALRERHEQPFTGFSDADDLPLAKLAIPEKPTSEKHGRPLPILNTSLNVVRGKELALQTRKARAFALCPTYSGYTRPMAGESDLQSIYGFTSEAESDQRNTSSGISLGTAMAISGAAASPNMGFHSQPSLSFLMTVFDVRLGWWLGNPNKEQPWKRGSPRFGFACLLKELLGATSDESEYIYLSDGGHFENLGIYELVRRGCRLIIASDASCDEAYGFGDLRNAVERCRMDFGVEIEIDTGVLKPPAGTKRSIEHYVVGQIHYHPGDTARDGTLIYLKPAIVEKDPVDVIGYSSTNPHFPHDTTANQWFDEAHFENYRALGEESGRRASETIAAQVSRTLNLQTTG
jgi:hypothetical protein